MVAPTDHEQGAGGMAADRNQRQESHNGFLGPDRKKGKDQVGIQWQVEARSVYRVCGSNQLVIESPPQIFRHGITF